MLSISIETFVIELGHVKAKVTTNVAVDSIVANSRQNTVVPPRKLVEPVEPRSPSTSFAAVTMAVTVEMRENTGSMHSKMVSMTRGFELA